MAGGSLERAPSEVTFNVVYTPGSVRRLLPFAQSLLHGSGVRIRVVSNGCEADEIELLHSASRRSDRISVHILPFASAVNHGHALNHLFTTFEEPIFAFADSDVLAGGDFADDLFSAAPGTAGVFTAPPVGLIDAEASLPEGETYLDGRHRLLPDGTPIGGTYVAAYERRALDQVWERAPRGFGITRRSLLDRGFRAELSRRGWSFRVFDTGRVVNLLLLLDGHRLENRTVPELHHVGGFTVRDFRDTGVGVRHLVRQLRAPDRQLLQRATDGAFMRLYSWRRGSRPGSSRRRIVRAHIDQVLGAIDAGRAVPEAPPTGSEQVDQRLSELVAALVQNYPAARI